MNVEISKEQKAALAEKISMCVEYLKAEIQPHLTSRDKLSANMGEELDLYLTSKEIFVKHTRYYSIGIDFPVSKVLYLEKDRKTANRYICDVEPELAVAFLENWDKAKQSLLQEVADKDAEVNKLTNFIDSFKL